MIKDEIDVLITSYNKPKLVTKAIMSVVNQTYVKWRLWIGEDNSNEETQTAINELLKELDDNRIILYNSGVSKEERPKEVRYALLSNVGEKATDGEYITNLADDDFMEPIKLEHAINEFKESAWKNILVGKQRLISLDENLEEIKEKTKIRDYYSDSKIIIAPAMVVDHSSPVIKRFCIENVGGWETNPKFWGVADAVLWNKLVNKGYWFYVVDEIWDNHCFSNISTSYFLDMNIPFEN